MSDENLVAGEGRERRYYSVPDDRQVKAACRVWQEQVPLEYCVRSVVSSVGGFVRLSVSESGGHHVATLYTTQLFDYAHVQAVSGWGPMSVMALRELAFRWEILMGKSWFTDNHVARLGLRGPMMGRLVDALPDLRT